MNVLHTEASSGWGGQEIRILKEAEGMRKKGYNVIIAVSKGGELRKRAILAGFLVYELNYRRPNWPICLFQLLKIIRRHKIQLVNTHSSLDSWIGGIAARIAGCAVIRTRHLSTPIKPGFNSRFVYGSLADAVVTTCGAIVPIIAKQSGKSLAQITSIATGVDPSHIQVEASDIAAFKEKYGLNGQFVVGTACMMRSWKGIDDLLMAANLLRDHSDIRWVIIGGGHSERHLKKAKELKLEKHVCFTGHLDNPFPGIASFDIFTLLSTAHEGISQAILQAAYLGKPLISTETGGLKEVCVNGQTGINVPPFSPEQVKDAVLQIKQDQNLREKFALAAKKLVLEKFTLKHTLDQMEAVYQKTLEACREKKQSVQSGSKK